MVLTAFYFVILSGILGLFSRVWRFVYCDMHLIRFFGDNQSTPQRFVDRAMATYHAADERNEIVMRVFGEDIGRLICGFLPRWHLLDDSADDISDDTDSDTDTDSHEDTDSDIMIPVMMNPMMDPMTMMPMMNPMMMTVTTDSDDIDSDDTDSVDEGSNCNDE